MNDDGKKSLLNFVNRVMRDNVTYQETNNSFFHGAHPISLFVIPHFDGCFYLQ
jgi:hypothetical protein